MKTTVYVGTSLDGFIARKDGDIDWLVKYQNKEVHDSYNEFINRIDAMVIGRGTFEKVLSFPEWPYEKKVFVLSTSLKQIPGTLNEKATLVAMKPAELLNYLSDKGFSNIYIDGGKVIQSFLREDLVDELIITKVPELIGTGIPLFGYLDNDLRFEHIKTNIYSDGLVKSQYKRKR
ncbi:MAG TPA: dihydrofolate reductase family protein [Chitinophagaceae bacterium]|nr:dihydrofolate reductase family protein [Chitinophagaceae bacterium]